MADSDSPMTWLCRWIAGDLGLQTLSENPGASASYSLDPEHRLDVSLAGQGTLFTFSCEAPVVFETRDYPTLYALLAQANLSSPLGAWVLDPNRGRIRFRVTIPAAGAIYEPVVLAGLIRTLTSTVAEFTASLRRQSLPDWAYTEDPTPQA